MMSGTVRRTVETALTKRYEALLRVSQTLISIRSSEELFSILARELRAVMNFSYLGVAIYDEKAQEVRLTSYSESGVPHQVPKLAPEETLTWWVYQHQQCLIIPSLDAETRFPAVAEMLKNCGVRSVCTLPLTTLNHRLGGLAVGSLAADAYSSEEVSFLSLVANQVALAVDDALDFDASQHAKEVLRGSEESFRLIVDSIPGLVVTMTAEGELEFVSQQCLNYFGMTLDELKGWTTSDIVHRDDLSRVLATWRRSIETGHPYDSEYRIRHADGVYRWFHVRALPLRGAEGRIIRWYALHADIDKRKQAEGRLQLLLDVTNQVVSNLQLRDLLRAISGNIRRVMQCDCASLALPAEENKQLQLYVLDFPEGKGFLREEGLYSIEGSPYGTAFRTMKPLALDRPFAAWADNPVVQSRIAEGFKSLCFIPLIRRNRAIG